MINNVYFQTVIIVLIIAYGLYSLVKVVKVFLEHINEKKEYMKKYNGNYEYEQDFYIWAIVYSLVALAAFILGITQIVNEQEYTMGAAMFFMGMFCITFILDVIMKRQAFFDEEGFFYERKRYRYRSIVKLEPRNSIIATYDLLLIGEENMRIPKKMGDMLIVKRKEYKKNKK